MTLRFRPLATVTALLFFVLSATLMFQPAGLLANWGVGFDESTGVISRRTAALYAGIGLMLFLARKAEPSPARSALVSGLLFVCALLAALGLLEWASGRASSGILASVVIEVGFALAFLPVARRPEGRAPTQSLAKT